MKKLISLVLVLAISFAMAVPAFASKKDINNLSITPPSTKPEITIDGASKPGSNASIHDLSISDYNYQVEDVGYQVFTDKWLKGASSIAISVDDWTLLEYYGGTSDQLTITVYNQSGQVSSKTISISGSSGSCTFSGLSSSTKYYIGFRVPKNSNRYSFDGSISAN